MLSSLTHGPVVVRILLPVSDITLLNNSVIGKEIIHQSIIIHVLKWASGLWSLPVLFAYKVSHMREMHVHSVAFEELLN